MAKQAPDTDKGRDTVRDQTPFQNVSTQSLSYLSFSPHSIYRSNVQILYLIW